MEFILSLRTSLQTGVAIPSLVILSERSESKDPGTAETAFVYSMRRSHDAPHLLALTKERIATSGFALLAMTA